MDKRKVAAIVEEFIDDIRKFNELKDEIAALQHEAAELREELIRGFDEENFFNITIEKALSNIDKEGSNVDIDEDSAKLDAAVLKMRKSGKFIKSNAVNGDYVLSLHLHDEKMLYKEYGGSPFDLDLFDIGKDENDRLLHQVDQHMDGLMKYGMEPNLPPVEIIFLGEKVFARRCDFQTLGEDKSVAPRILTVVERFDHHEEQFFWWILAMLSRPDPRSPETLSEPRKWKEWCGAIQICQKVYVPMVIKRQWILSVLVMKLKKVDVYDDFSICSTDLGLTIMDTLLSSMDNAFKESRSEAFGPGWKFFDFVVAEAHDHRRCVSSLKVMNKLLGEYVDGVNVFCAQVPESIHRLYIGSLILTSEVNKVGDITMEKAIHF
ncbi:hypothetical protein CsatB_017215 [Cannabis sativa]